VVAERLLSYQRIPTFLQHVSAAELETVLHREIPLSRHMGVRVAACGLDRVVLSAPLENNLNHKSTAFGGSLYSLAVLSGWSLLFIFLRARGVAAQIVIHQSNIEYLHPVRNDFTAECAVGDSALLERALASFARRGVARVRLVSTVRDGDTAAVRFQGSYALLRAER